MWHILLTMFIVSTTSTHLETCSTEEVTNSIAGAVLLQTRTRGEDHIGSHGRCPGVEHLTSNEPPRDPDMVHFIYTTGCNQYQLIQAVTLDHSWRLAGNRGRLTRIAVGCEDAKARALLESSPLQDDPDFAVFFAEGSLMTMPGTKDQYPARSRPYAIMQWLEAKRAREPTIAILDPDFVWQRPLSENPCFAAVRPGRMLAQQYDLTFLQGFAQNNETAPVVTREEVTAAYSTGPPWVMDAGDLRKMLPDWGRYTDGNSPKEGLLREQEAFNMAALRHGVPAMGQDGLMVSSASAGNEAWSRTTSTPQDWRPYVLHYCQIYDYGGWNFYKAFLSDGWWYEASYKNSVPPPITCGAPLLQEPPAPPTEASEPDRSKLKKAWMLSKLIPSLNKAFLAYRAKYCQKDLRASHLARTMWPRSCSEGKTTRYLVANSGGPSSWLQSAAIGGDPCGQEAQLMTVPVKEPASPRQPVSP